LVAGQHGAQLLVRALAPMKMYRENGLIPI
jgi:hypothetical protein